MALKEDLAQLYQLQIADTNLAHAQAELTGLDDGGRAARRAHQARDAAEQALTGLHAAEGQLKDRELALEGTETERKTKSAKAFGGTVTDGKELSALERKIEELSRRKGKLEEEVLALYEQVDALRTAEAEARELATDLTQKAKKIRAEYQTRSAALTAQVAELTAQRAETAAPVPAGLRGQYDKLRAANQGVAVAAISGSTCGYCHSRTPNEQITLAKHGTQMVRCESCTCILVAE